MPVSPEMFKGVMARWPSGVTVVTTEQGGQRIGITASSFSSVSLEPPLILICINKKLYTSSVIRERGAFGINILARDQAEIGKRFAGMVQGVDDRFVGLNVQTAATGVPLLGEALAWLDCSVYEVFDAGDHLIYIGQVEAADRPRETAPLLYHNRAWSKPAEALPAQVELVEVGLRDGLQRETTILSTAQKVQLIEGLVAAGLKRIQVTAFVHLDKVPQMADAEVLCAALPDADGVIYSALALNLRGVERASAAGMRYIDVGISASDAHSRANTGLGLGEARVEFARMVDAARRLGLHVRGSIQCAFGFREAGDVSAPLLLELAREWLDLGVDELALADSAGLANPVQMHDILCDVVALAGPTPLVLHLHDTRGMGMANLLTALKTGVRRFDTALGGLGGCPFIPEATGNIATEDVAHMLGQMGIETGIDLKRSVEVARLAAGMLGRALPGRLAGLS